MIRRTFLSTLSALAVAPFGWMFRHPNRWPPVRLSQREVLECSDALLIFLLRGPR
jgi:hypothetical protein